MLRGGWPVLDRCSLCLEEISTQALQPIQLLVLPYLNNFTRPHWTHYPRGWLPFHTWWFHWHLEGHLAPRHRKMQGTSHNYFILVYPCPQPTSRKVAIKVVRAKNENENGHEKMNRVCGPSRIVLQIVHTLAQRLQKEMLVWHKLDHKNILPLLGITFEFGRDNPIGMVCPWVRLESSL